MRSWSSRFLSEAFGLPEAPEGGPPLSPRESIARHAPVAEPPPRDLLPIADGEPLEISHSKIRDYLSCPFKYRFAHATGSAAPFKGGGVEVFVEDNGAPQGGHAVDANAFRPPEPAGVFDAGAAQCDDPNTATYDTVTSGDYAVRDR